MFREEPLQILPVEQEKDVESEQKQLVIEQIFTHCDTGSVVWDSGLILLDFLKNFRSMVVGKRVLELGAGTGYVGIGSFLLGADFVLCTDREKQVPLIQRNLQRNLSQNENLGKKQSMDVLSLDWDSYEDLQRVMGRIQENSSSFTAKINF